MLEIQSRPGISPAGLQSLSHWAQLEEQAAKRLMQERMMLIELNREMGNRDAVERLSRTKYQFQNPFYMVKPGPVDALAQSLSNLQKISATQNMIAGVNDMTTGIPISSGKGPQTIDMTDKPAPSFESRPQWQQQQAKGQGGLDVLLALQKGGVAPSDNIINRLANINNNAIQKYSYDPQGQKVYTPQGQFESGLLSEIESSPFKVKQQQEAIDKYNASPNRQMEYLDERTADELKNTVINAFYDAVKTTNDPMEIRRYYSIAHNALHGLDVAWKRENTSTVLGELKNYLPGRPGTGSKTDNVRIYYSDGSSEMGTVPANAGAGFKYRDFLEKNYTKKGLKINRYSIEGSGGPKSPGELAKDTYTVKQAIASARSLEEAKQIAEEAGFEIVPSDSITDKILSKIGPLKQFRGYSVVRKGSGGSEEMNAESFMKKYGLTE